MALGLLAVMIVVLPVLLVAELLRWMLQDWVYLLLEVLVLYLALSIRGLTEHGRAVSDALHRGDIERAREQVGRIVSRQDGRRFELATCPADCAYLCLARKYASGLALLANSGTVNDAIGLVRRGVWLWLGLLGLVAVVAALVCARAQTG